jgi:hypothetical protein
MDIKLALKHFWTWRKNNVWGWVESIALTLVLLLFCKFINPGNPLFVKESFSWPWIASIIIVFQYGFGPGLLSVALISVLAIYYKSTEAITIPDFQNYLLTGITLMLICALFSSGWIRRLINTESLNLYTEDRLKSLSRSYYTLRISFDYLEQNIMTKPLTLRIALEKLEKLNVKQNENLSHEVAYSFLQIISQFCSVNTLGIYLYKNKKLINEPFAEIGSMGCLIQDDPLIKYSMLANELCFASIDQIEDASDCNYLVAMPLIINDNECLGLLVIKEMPFWNLNTEIIRILSILVYYFVSEIVVAPEIAELIRTYPDCSVDFAKQIVKLMPLKKNMDIDSAVVAVLVDKSLRTHNIIYNLKNQHRLLDSYCSLELEHYDVLITLMPFTNGPGIQGYLTRINDYLYSELGLPHDNQKIKTRSIQLYGDSPLVFMYNFQKFIEEKNFVE